MSNMPKWTKELTEELTTMVGDENPVSVATVMECADNMERTNRSITSKLRKLGFEVESMAQAHVKSFTDAEEAKLRTFVEANEGVYTYAEIAQQVFGNDRTARQVQGKLLAMELTSYAKKTPPKEVTKAYTEVEEVTFVKMAEEGAFLEDIADALGKPLNSVRGKALSLTRSIDGFVMPKQKESHAKTKGDPFDGVDVINSTVEEIAEAIGKTARGVKTMLTYRGLVAKDYDGATRAEKNANKKAEAEAEAAA